MPNALEDMSEFTIGMHVRVRGVIKYSQHAYLWILAKSDIVKASDDRKTIFLEVLRGVDIPKKRALEQ